ncbi:MAG: TIGR03986 family CRISPR-associated RAMP protein [Saprospiraceae bacterium]
MLKAPYNFVPVNHKVVPAYWGDFISHDVPFEDGESGTIQVTIHTHSPLFVRDGLKDKEEDKVQQFSSFSERYFIPGSSIKGMLRNVLEILTFSKMNMVNDHRFAIRDLNAAEVYRERIKINEINAGWLQKKGDGNYVIKDCGTPGRISHRHLDDIYGTDFSTYFLKKEKGGSFNQGDENEKAARFKYKRFGTQDRKNTFVFDYEDVMREIYIVEKEPLVPQAKRGTIVFTGQPSPRFSKLVPNKNGELKEKWFGHHLEFIFFEGGNKEIEVDETVMTNFFFAYHEPDKNRWSIDWKHWRERLNKGEQIPVFFRKYSERSNGVDVDKIKDLGLSYMYKLPYDQSVKQAIPHSHNEEVDMAEAMFGFTSDVGNDGNMNALKGRIHVGHAFALNDVTLAAGASDVLSGPKASYYPNYIRQKSGDRYNTFWDKHAEIAGWKRYPIHSDGIKRNPASSDVKDPSKIETAFVPIEKGAIFSFKISYHNLKKVELGALLSAISFHNTPNTFHSLGMAKPLGYGKVTLTVSGIDNIDDYLKTFEAFMRASDTGTKEWHESEQIRELVTMASEQDNDNSSKLEYMALKGFSKAKNDKLRLEMYSRLNNIHAKGIQSIAESTEVEIAKKYITEERKIYQAKLQPSEALSRYKQTLKTEFEDRIAKKKDALKQQLNERKAALQRQQSLGRKAELQKKAEEEGPDWSKVNDKDGKKGFDGLKKVIREHGEQLHDQKEKDLLVNFPNGYLPTEYHAKVFEIVTSLYNAGSQKDKQNWCKPFHQNAYMKKISEWMGKEMAQKLLDTLSDI